MTDLLISDWRFTLAPEEDRLRGLLAYCVLDVGPYQVDGIAIRRTQRGKLTVAYPARQGRNGKSHPYFLPREERHRDAIERQLIAAFRQEFGDA